MSHFAHSLTFAGLTALFAYLLMVGATYGILVASVRALSFVAVAAVGLGWLYARRRGRWHWTSTALDRPFLLWTGAIALSLLMNSDTWRRQAIGIWFVGLYIAVWYLLSDLTARGLLRRGQLLQVVALGGIITVVLGFVQIFPWLGQQFPLMLSGQLPFALPRPGSSLGNPNTLAAVLVVFVPFAIALALSAHGLPRVLSWVVSAAATLLMALTYSRGGWLGLLAALSTQSALLLLDRGLLNVTNARDWWSRQDRTVRAGVVTTLLVGVLVAVGILIVGLFSLGQGGRSLDLRTFLYAAAVNQFADQPLAGHGLFTFGQGLAEQVSTPPYQTHSHAHNMVLHIAAELGLAGLIALLATLLAVARAFRANWRIAGPRDRMLLSGAGGAVVGFAVHHQLDFPAMVPVVALTGVVALVAACATVNAAAQREATPSLVAALWIGLIVSGGWGIWLYNDYSAALNSGIGGDGAADFRRGADQLQDVVDRDPSLAVTHYQQGMFYGLAAYYGDPTAVTPAVEAFRHYVDFEPQYATGWVNLSALQRQSGDLLAAVESARRAVATAPEFWFYQYLLARTQELAGDADAARATYVYLLRSQPDVLLLPDWATPLRQELAARVPPSPLAQVALLLEANDIVGAKARLERDDISPQTPAALALGVWLLAAEGRAAEAEVVLERLRLQSTTPDAEAWWLLASSKLQAGTNDAAAAPDRARGLLAPAPLVTDDADLPNIHYIQYLHTALPRTYLPQVGYPSLEPLLQHLLRPTP